MKDYLVHKIKYYKNFADAVYKDMMQLRYGIYSNVAGIDVTKNYIDWMRFQLIGYQEHEDNDALTSTAMRFRTWLAVDYSHLSPSGRHHLGGSCYSRNQHGPQNLGLNYNYGPGESQNIIEINAGGCITRINLNPAISINNGSKYQHHQSEPLDVWVIQHNLGFIPNVFTTDSGGVEIEGVVEPIDDNSLQIIFSEPVAGYAYLS